MELEQMDQLELLGEVEKAIRAILLGGQSYSIGSRSLTRADLGALRSLRTELQGETAGENCGLLSGAYVAEFLPR